MQERSKPDVLPNAKRFVHSTTKLVIRLFVNNGYIDCRKKGYVHFQLTRELKMTRKIRDLGCPMASPRALLDRFLILTDTAD